MTGYKKEQLIGMSIGDLDNIESPEMTAERIERIVANGSEFFETWHRRRDGSIFPVEVSTTWLPIDGGRLVCFGRNISERKHAEARILHLQKAESLGRMAGAVAHHYNNLLTVVMGNLEMAMLDMPGDREQSESLTHAMEAARRASKLGTMMLAYLGQTNAPRKLLDLSLTCKGFLPALRADMPAHITLEADLQNTGPAVTANARQIQQILECLEKVAKAAKHHMPVLITGETGTGKELFSRAIHINSSRSHAAFVVVDCAALPDHLVESTLFGHAKGAFTGADTSQTGLMEMADKGTLFLDEVGELPFSVQKNFLRAIQEKQFRPIGAAHEIKSDFRLICATHRNLPDMVKDNSFREDLYFRLFSMHIHLPPLKSRKSDVAALVQTHLSHKYDISKSKGKGVTVSKDFLEELQTYDWPGNVRELINTLDLVCSDAGTGDTLFAHHLPAHIRAFHIRNKFNTLPPVAADLTNVANPLQFKNYMEKMKLAYLQDLVSATSGDIAECCGRSGLSRSQMYRLIQQYNLKIN